MVPRQPVADHRRPVLEKRPHLRPHLLVGAQHALRVDHALGRAGRARGEQDLGHAVRANTGKCLIHARRRRRLQQFGDRRRLRAHGRERRSELRRIGGVHQTRAQQLEDRLELGEVLRHQRIGRRDRRHRDADVHRAEREQGVVHRIVREDGERAFGVEAALEQRTADAPHGVERLAVGHLAPAVLGSLREERAIRRLVRPVGQPFSGAARVRTEQLRGAQQHRAVPALLHIDERRGVAQARMQGAHQDSRTYS